jgi:hypothetical protein
LIIFCGGGFFLAFKNYIGAGAMGRLNDAHMLTMLTIIWITSIVILFKFQDHFAAFRRRVLIHIPLIICEILLGIFVGLQVADMLKPPPPSRFDGGCGPGCVIEDAGKRNVEHLPEVEALRQKYGEERLFIKALDRHLVGRETEWHTNHALMKEHDDLLYAVRPDWDPKITGCVIVVYAGGEGYVYQEDKDLNVIGTETLAEFLEHTKNVSPEMMYRFFLSLH